MGWEVPRAKRNKKQKIDQTPVEKHQEKKKNKRFRGSGEHENTVRHR